MTPIKVGGAGRAKGSVPWELLALLFTFCRQHQHSGHLQTPPAAVTHGWFELPLQGSVPNGKKIAMALSAQSPSLAGLGLWLQEATYLYLPFLPLRGNYAWAASRKSFLFIAFLL